MEPTLNQTSPGYLVFAHISWVLSLALTITGIVVLPADLWMKGYLAMGLFFTVGATITLSKTLRDNHEARKVHNRLHEVKTERILKEYDMTP